MPRTRCCWSEPGRAASCWRTTATGATGRCAARSARAGPSTTRCTTPSRARSTRPPRASGTARRSGAARTSGETWELSSEGLAYEEDGEPQGLEGLVARRPGRAPARRRRGAGHLREPRRRRDVVAADDARGPAGERGLGRPGEPAAGPPRHLGDHARRRDPARFWAIVQGVGLFETRRRRHAWTPRNRGLRADWPRAARGGRLLRAQARPLAGRPRPHVPAEPRRHAPLRRRRANRGRRSPRACRPSSASPRRRTRTTATPST